MRLSPVSKEEARADAANIAGTAFLPEQVIIEQRQRWEQRRVNKHSSEPIRLLAALFVKESVEAEIEMRNAKQGDLQGDMSGAVQRQQRLTSAGEAIGRLMDILLTGTEKGAYVAGEAYPGTTLSKRLLDYDELDPLYEERGAHAVIVHKDLLKTPPFDFDGSVAWDNGEAWYVNRERGLYVAAGTPAVASQSLERGLAISAGGPKKAKALIDAPNSVNLLPYLSLDYLAARA